METTCAAGIRVGEVQYITMEAVRAGSADLEEYYTLFKRFSPRLLYILANNLETYLPKRHIYKNGRMT